MSATTFGNINFGLTTETGFYAESFTGDYTVQEKYIADGDGDDVAGAVFKPEMSGTIEGAYNTTGSPTWVMGGTITVANIPTHTAFINGYTTGGRYIVTGANVGKGNESEERRTINFKFKPFMAAS